MRRCRNSTWRRGAWGIVVLLGSLLTFLLEPIMVCPQAQSLTCLPGLAPEADLSAANPDSPVRLVAHAIIPQSKQPTAPISSSAQQVIELTNQARARAGLSPLKAAPQLDQAAMAHCQAMAAYDFHGHENPVTGSTLADRVQEAGYDWSYIGENVAAGQSTPAEAVNAWMGSPDHRANILDPGFREIGVGYVFDASDTFPCNGSPCSHYWTQDFGTRQDVYPLVINAEAFSTTTPDVSLFIYGQGWAHEMRLRNDEGDFSAWEPFVSSNKWTLAGGDGWHSVTVELRDAAGTVRTATDDIYLQWAGPTAQVTPFQSVPSQTPVPLTPSGADTLHLERSATASALTAGDEVEVTLQLSGNALPCGEQVVRTPLDIVLVIDHSGSMGDMLGMLFGGTKLDGAKQAAITFLSAVELGTDQVAVVAFDHFAFLAHGLSTDVRALSSAIQALEPGGGTNIADGLLAALDELNSPRRRGGAAGVVILLSDGQSPAAAAAEQVKDAGHRVVTIGLGMDVDEDEMRRIASSPADYHFSPDTAQLQAIFLDIAQDIRRAAAATEVVVTHRFDATNFEVVEGSILPQGRLAFDRITWRLPKVGTESVQLRYRLRSRLPGTFDLDLGDEVTYLRCGQDRRTISLGSGLSVQVQANPNATPTPLLTPPPTPLTPGQALTNLACGDFPWWFILPLLLFLILLVLVLWKNLAGIRERLQQGRRWPKPCLTMGLVLLAYGAFLLGLLLRELQPAICQPREAIYFWQVTSEGESAILYKPVSPELPVREFQALNRQARCIACHTISLKGDTIAAIADGSNGPITVMRLDGTLVGIPPITGSYLALSPDGKKLAYAAEGKDIYILDIESGATVPLAGASEPGVIETMPSWSPDGNTIAFVRAVGDVRGYSLAVPCDIYTIPAQGGVATLLPGAGGNGFNYYPAYSPDGRWLAFTRHTAGSSTRADPQAEIYLVPAQGGEARRLEANDLPGGQRLTGVSNSWPTWSPDGRFLAFNSKRNGGQFDIYVTQIDPEGGSGPARPLADAARPDLFEHLPQWGKPPQVNLLARLLSLLPWLIPIPILLLLAWMLCRRREYPHTVRLEREVTPDSGPVRKQTFSVRLTLTGDSTTCEKVRLRRPVDVVLALDISGSMSAPARAGLTERKLDGAKSAAQAFADRLDLAQDRIGLVTFNDQAEVRHSLDADPAGLRNAIAALDCEGGTAIHDGLRVALDELRAFRRAQAVGAIVLLSDGQSDAAEAMAQAEAIEEDNIRLITVAFGDDADRDLLKDLASSPADSHISASNRQLEQVFRSIAEQIQEPIAATDLVFIHRANIEDFDLDETSIYPRPDHVVNGAITWRLPHLANVSRTFRYQTRAKRPGDPLNLDLGDLVRYRRCGEMPKELRENRPLPVSAWEAKEPERPPVAPLRPPEPLRIPERKPVWDPDAALFIGVGTFGRQVLVHLRKNLRDAGAGKIADRLQFLLLDSAQYRRRGERPLRFAGVQLDDQDILILDENLNPVVREMLDSPEAHPELRPWFPAESYTGPQQQQTLAEGTHGERPLARAGLVRHINGRAGGAGPTLIERLRERLPRVRVPVYGVRVILVGSLSEGMGGTLWDLAYLAREIARQTFRDEQVAVTVEGYLELRTESAPAVVTDAERNGLCGLRELTWFQLNPGMPYRIAYGKADFDGTLQPLRDRLVDDLYLFTTPSKRADALPPVVADLVTLRLDAKARMVEDRDWYDEQRNQVKGREAEHRELFFGTGGSFAMRLPAYDLIEMVKARWAREMLHAFLMGENRGELAFSSAFASDPGLPASPAALIPGFMVGDWHGLEYEYELGVTAPDTLRALGLVHEGRVQEARALLATPDEAGMRKYLGEVLRLILMGTTLEETTWPRAGKIGYAIEFLEGLRDLALGELRQLVDQADVSPEQQRVLEQTRTVLCGQVESALQQLRNVQDYLGQVYSSLRERESELASWRKEMDQLSSRLYLWQELVGPEGHILAKPRELKDVWYELAYNVARPEANVQALSWVEGASGGLELELRALGGIAARSDTDSAEQFAAKMLAFAGGRILDVQDPGKQTALDSITLASLSNHVVVLAALRQRGHTEADEKALAELRSAGIEKAADVVQVVAQWVRARALPESDVSGHFDSTQVPGGMVRRAALAVYSPEGEALTSLQNAMPEKDFVGGSGEQLTRLRLSDKLSWQLVRTIDVLSPIALKRYKGIYSQLAQEDKRRAVFDWEAMAQQRCSGLDNTLLHPLVAAALVDEKRACLYGLAYASGWVGQEQGTWGLRTGMAREPLLSWAPSPGWDGAVYGLLHFVFRATASHVGELESALDHATPSLLDRWRTCAAQESWQQFREQDRTDTRSLRLLAWYAVRKKVGELSP